MDILKLNILCLSIIQRRRRRHRRQREYYQHPIVAARLLEGTYYTLHPRLLQCERKFFNYYRLSISSFNELYGKLEPYMQRDNFKVKIPISPRERLALTLRFLASGNSYTDLHYSYRIGITTISEIVAEVCTVIWNVLRNECLSFPSTEDMKRIAVTFQNTANFPYCIGAIDGKHVRITSPEHSGSLFCNYKKYYSIVLLAMCDAQYRFTYINVGSCGTESDSTIFKGSSLFTRLQNGQIDLPAPQPLPNTNDGESVPFVIIGDAAFAISNHVLRPYARSNMTYKKKIFNYRLSRARRYIESTFGILSNKFRIFHRPMNTSLENTTKIVKACCVLHNFIRDRDGYITEHTMTIAGLETRENHYSIVQQIRTGDAVRNQFANYFISPEGLVPWQDRSIF